MYLESDNHDLPLNGSFLHSDIYTSPRTGIVTLDKPCGNKIRLSDLNRALLDMGEAIQGILGDEIALVRRLSSKSIPVRLDLDLLNEMLLNLASSARETKSEEGQFIVETEMVRLPLNYTQKYPSLMPGLYAMLLVQDTGTGMIPSTCDYFDAFLFERKLELMAGRSVFTAYGYIEKINACLSLRSQSEGGTLLRVYFPLA